MGPYGTIYVSNDIASESTPQIHSLIIIIQTIILSPSQLVDWLLSVERQTEQGKSPVFMSLCDTCASEKESELNMAVHSACIPRVFTTNIQ